MSDYFKTQLRLLVDLSRTPAAVLLRTAIITRDINGDFYLLFAYSYHAERIISIENITTTREILKRIYHLNDDFKIFAGNMRDNNSAILKNSEFSINTKFSQMMR